VSANFGCELTVPRVGDGLGWWCECFIGLGLKKIKIKKLIHAQL